MVVIDRALYSAANAAPQLYMGTESQLRRSRICRRSAAVVPSSAASDLVAKQIALVHIHRQLRGQRRRVAIRVQVIHRWPAGAAAIKAERAEGAAVGAHLQYRFLGQQLVFAAERRA